MKTKQQIDKTRIHSIPSLRRLRKASIALISMGALAGCLCAQETANLVPNGDFEMDAMGPGLPRGWGAAYERFDGDIEIAANTRPESSGKQCVQFNPTGEMKHVGINSALVPIDPQKTYIQSAWIKTEGRKENVFGVSLGHAWYDKDKRPLPNAKSTCASYVADNIFPDDWAFISSNELVPAQQPGSQYGVFEIPREAAYVQIQLVSYYYEGKSWFSDLRIEEQKLPLAPSKPAAGKIPAGESKRQ